MNRAETRTMRGSGRQYGIWVWFTVSLAMLALCGGTVAAQDTPFTSAIPFESSGERPIRLFGGDGPPPSFSPVEGDAVLLSAVAENKVLPVDGLGAGDFTLEVNGKKTAITRFARRPAGTDANGVSSSVDGFVAPGWYVALFDLTIADPVMMKEAGARLLETIEARLDQDEQVAVIFFDGRIDVVAPFTRDPALIRAALDKLPARSVYNIHDFFGMRVRVTPRGELKITSTLDQSDDTAQHNFAAYRFFTELRRLALELEKLPGRKQVMLVSGGFNRIWLANEDVAYLRMVNAMCRATAAVYTFNAVGEDYLKRLLAEDGIRRKKQEKAGPNELKHAAKFLSELAESTGARAWTAKDGEEEIVGTLFRDGRHHYLLGFPRATGTRTGDFLPCEIRVDGGVSEVRAPLGFYDN